MQLTKATVDLLKNFSTINGSILVKAGNKLETISATKNILASADVSETFETQFGIYDLNEFLNLATSEAFIGADLQFQEKSVVLKNGRSRSRYYYADPSTIISPTKMLNMPDINVRVKISSDDLKRIKSMASILGKNDFTISGLDDEIIMSVSDKKDPTTNNFEMNIAKFDENDVYESFSMSMKMENLKLIGGDYVVNLAEAKDATGGGTGVGVAHFVNTSVPVEYYIAMVEALYGTTRT